MTNEFSVYWKSPDGTTHKELAFVGAREAVQMAHSLSTRPAVKLGVIREILITDGDDFVCFLWKNGQIVYPEEAAIKTSQVRHDH